MLALPRQVFDARGQGAARRIVARLDLVDQGEPWIKSRLQANLQRDEAEVTHPPPAAARQHFTGCLGPGGIAT
jgi:hypothetical protein